MLNTGLTLTLQYVCFSCVWLQGSPILSRSIMAGWLWLHM